MNYKQVRDMTLQLIDQYSVAGKKIPDTYNGQADYLKRIPNLLNDAAMQAATTTAPIRELDDLKNLRCDDNGAWLIYTLPENCWQLCSGGLIRFDGDGCHRFHRYHPVGRNKIAVPRDLTGEVQVEYFRYPRMLSENPAEEEELDNSPAVQMALSYYAAAQLVMQEDSYAFSALREAFGTRLARLGERLHTEFYAVENVYGE